jgi:glycosyltransferase involved in cell wall biosynthesis
MSRRQGDHLVRLGEVRVLVFHGYLLRGTGSNIYNASLAAALERLGHEVHLLCQERHASELSFVGTVGNWDSGELVLERIRATRCTVYRPNIGGLLPVYVPDRYEGIDARPFPELRDAQLDFYLRANVEAVADVVACANPDVALANHLVMGPAILARALSGTGVPYAVKVHGSDLEYTVRPHPRFLRYAREGLSAAKGVLVGSRHTAESLWATLEDSTLPARTRLGPPGVDVDRFRPRERSRALAQCLELADRVADQARRSELQHQSSHDVASNSAFTRDTAGTAKALAELAESAPADRIVTFVGKLIVAKGIDLLLLAWPFVLAAVPAVRLAVVGFGGYRATAERLVDAFSRGDLSTVSALAADGHAADSGRDAPLTFAGAFLDWLEASSERERYVAAAREMRDRVVFTGRLEHHELADFLPLCEALVVPSTFPESFGMVVIEAAACGVLPITASQSALAELSQSLGTGLPEHVRQLLSFPLGPDAVQSIAARLIEWLRTPHGEQDMARAHLVEKVRRRDSWDGVAKRVIAVAQGEPEEFDPLT